MHTFPSEPNLAITRFGTDWPATKFTFDANGRASPPRHTVKNPAAAGFVAVTFNTAAAPPAGPSFPTRRSSDLPGGGVVVVPVGAVPSRVSTIRVGLAIGAGREHAGNNAATSTTTSVAAIE